MIKCKKCGNRIREKEKYCSECGRKVYFWSKTHWIFLGCLIIGSGIINLLSGSGSFQNFLIQSLIMIGLSVFIWYENSPERIAVKKEKRIREKEEREKLTRIRKESRAAEIGRMTIDSKQ